MKENEWFEFCTDCGDMVTKGEVMEHFSDCYIHSTKKDFKVDIFKIHKSALIRALNVER